MLGSFWNDSAQAFLSKLSTRRWNVGAQLLVTGFFSYQGYVAAWNAARKPTSIEELLLVLKDVLSFTAPRSALPIAEEMRLLRKIIQSRLMDWNLRLLTRLFEKVAKSRRLEESSALGALLDRLEACIDEEGNVPEELTALIDEVFQMTTRTEDEDEGIDLVPVSDLVDASTGQASTGVDLANGISSIIFDGIPAEKGVSQLFKQLFAEVLGNEEEDEDEDGEKVMELEPHSHKVLLHHLVKDVEEESQDASEKYGKHVRGLNKDGLHRMIKERGFTLIRQKKHYIYTRIVGKGTRQTLTVSKTPTSFSSLNLNIKRDLEKYDEAAKSLEREAGKVRAQN